MSRFRKINVDYDSFFTSLVSSSLNLANKIFIHHFISNHNIMTSTTQSYNFIVLIETLFDEREFKEILIDTNAIFVSIDELKQLATLQWIRVVELRKFEFRSNDIIFDVDNIFVVDCVELNTFLRMIVFYIIEIDTSFLLFFANMNRLKMYFNNVSEWWFWNNQKEEEHFFEDVNSMY
jgi:hypothetical protein